MDNGFLNKLKSINTEIVTSNKVTEKKIIALSDIQDDIMKAINEYQEKNGENIEIYADYEDKLSDTQIKEILQSDYPLDTFYDIINDGYEDYDIVDEYEYIFDHLNISEDIKQEYHADIIEAIQENFYINYPYDHFLSQDIMVDLYPTFDDVEGDEFLIFDDNNILISVAEPIAWLIERQGYSIDEFIQYYNSLENREDPDTNTFFGSLISELNEAYYDGLCGLVFLGKISLEDYIKGNFKFIVIPPKTICGLVNTNQGAGSLLDINLEKAINLPKDEATILFKDGYRYNVDEIFGLVRDAWSSQFELKE